MKWWDFGVILGWSEWEQGGMHQQNLPLLWPPTLVLLWFLATASLSIPSSKVASCTRIVAPWTASISSRHGLVSPEYTSFHPGITFSALLFLSLLSRQHQMPQDSAQLENWLVSPALLHQELSSSSSVKNKPQHCQQARSVSIFLSSPEKSFLQKMKSTRNYL